MAVVLKFDKPIKLTIHDWEIVAKHPLGLGPEATIIQIICEKLKKLPITPPTYLGNDLRGFFKTFKKVEWKCNQNQSTYYLKVTMPS